MELVVLAADPGPELLTKWQERAGAGGLKLHLHLCESLVDADFAVSRAIQRELEKAGAFIEFSARDGLHVLRQSDIVFLRAHGHHAEIGMADGRIHCSKSLRVPVQTVLSPFMEGKRFLQTAKAAFVNADYVDRITPEGVWLSTGTVFPITRNHYNTLLAKCREAKATAAPCGVESGGRNV